MSKYKVGQRVHLEWPDGTIVEGVLTSEMKVGRTTFMPYAVGSDDRIVTVLEEPPRLEAPTGIGAVAEANCIHWMYANRKGRRAWIFNGTMWIPEGAPFNGNGDWVWAVEWESLVDPVIISDGWSPTPTKSTGFTSVYNTTLCTRCAHERGEHAMSMNGCSRCPCPEFQR
jgi:hypothetical protein